MSFAPPSSLAITADAIAYGERVVYVADFNVPMRKGVVSDWSRVDTELEDLALLHKAGAKVAILAHHGRYGDALEFGFIAPYLEEKLQTGVRYVPHNVGEEALQTAAFMRPGDIALFSNTRMHEGEEKNDPALAKEFSRLGDMAIIGGFGKAHRSNSSNIGILTHLRGYLAQSHVREMELLAPWSGAKDNRYSVAAIGGVKKEKITQGLKGFSGIYDSIIPGGIVLNTILKAKGYRIGDSLVADSGKTFEHEVTQILNNNPRAHLHVPEQVFIAPVAASERWQMIDVTDGVPKGYMIVDSVLPPTAMSSFERAAHNGRIILAGTLGLYGKGHTWATDTVVHAMRSSSCSSLVLGGDTAADTQFTGACSTGGGSALYFLTKGTTPVVEAFARQRATTKEPIPL